MRDALVPDLWIDAGHGGRARIQNAGAAEDVMAGMDAASEGANPDLFRELTPTEKTLISDDFDVPDIWVFGDGWVIPRWIVEREFYGGGSDPRNSDPGVGPRTFPPSPNGSRTAARRTSASTGLRRA